MASNILFCLALFLLGSNDFDSRQAGSKFLEVTLPFSAKWIVIGMESKDPEVKHRCKILKAKYDRMTYKWVVSLLCADGWTDVPMIQHFPNVHSVMQRGYIRSAEKIVGEDRGKYKMKTQRQAARLYLYDCLATGTTLAQVREMIATAKYHENNWHRIDPITKPPLKK